jgi:hypothetical protein
MLAMELLGIHPFVLILICLAVAFSRNRSARHRRRFDPIDDATRELTSRKESARAHVDQHKVRLHDTAREAQAVLQTSVAVLDRMVVDTDREIARLEEFLHEIRNVPTPRLAEFREQEDQDDERDSSTPFIPSGESAQFVRLLHRSGFSANEIAESMNSPLDVIREILGHADDSDSKAA